MVLGMLEEPERRVNVLERHGQLLHSAVTGVESRDLDLPSLFKELLIAVPVEFARDVVLEVTDSELDVVFLTDGMAAVVSHLLRHLVSLFDCPTRRLPRSAGSP